MSRSTGKSGLMGMNQNTNAKITRRNRCAKQKAMLTQTTVSLQTQHAARVVEVLARSMNRQRQRTAAEKSSVQIIVPVSAVGTARKENVNRDKRHQSPNLDKESVRLANLSCVQTIVPASAVGTARRGNVNRDKRHQSPNLDLGNVRLLVKLSCVQTTALASAVGAQRKGSVKREGRHQSPNLGLGSV